MTDPPPASTKPTPLGRRVFSLPSLIALAVAVAFIIFLATRFDLDWTRTWNNVRSMDPGLYATALALYYLSFVFRGIRWRILARNAGLTESPDAPLPGILKFSQLILVGWFVNSVAWLRLGDAYRAYALSEESSIRFSSTLGTVLAERAVDMATVLALVIVGVGAYSLTQDTEGLGHIVAAAVIMAAALALLLAVMWGYGARLARFLPGRVEEAYRRFHQGTIGSLRQVRLVFALGFIGWVLEVGRLYFVIHALDLEVGLPLVIIAALGHAILSTVPIPGGVGVVEPGVTGLLALGLARDDAVSAAIVDRSVTYLSVLVLGGLAFLALQASQSRRRRSPATGPVTATGSDEATRCAPGRGGALRGGEGRTQ